MSNATSSKSTSKDALPPFPKGTPTRAQFDNWLFKVKSFMTARKMQTYLEKPLRDMPELDGTKFEEVADVEYIEQDANNNKQKHHDNCVTAYDYLVHSTNDGQIDLVRTVHVG